MPEPLQFFKYRGPEADGGRDTAEGRRSYPMAMTDNVVSTVQIFKKGVHNRLHVHLTEDGYWFVLGGRVRFYGVRTMVNGIPDAFTAASVAACSPARLSGELSACSSDV